MHVSERLHNHDNTHAISSDPGASGAAVSCYSLPTRRPHISGLWQATHAGIAGQVGDLPGLPGVRRVHVIHLQCATNYSTGSYIV